ncbi:ATP synthase subunit s, mitochondrial-like [Mya arenaria]|nr:ATP synthase subunit s, mitochondrial-like [Mya arenaria]
MTPHRGDSGADIIWIVETEKIFSDKIRIMFRTVSTILKGSASAIPKGNIAIGSYLQRRYFIQLLDRILNSFDKERLQSVGPDRLCAEWVLKTGGRVRWAGANHWLQDFNFLPPEDFDMKLQDIDATECSVMSSGFKHFQDCQHIRSVKLHGCKYVDDVCMLLLQDISGSLRQLQVSSNKKVTDKGLVNLTKLVHLTDLHLKDLPSVQNKQECYQQLTKALPNCDIMYMDVK